MIIKLAITAALTTLLITIILTAIWTQLGMPSMEVLRTAISISSNKQDCQKYAHYENGQQVYEYVKCIPVTPVTINP